jgi:transcriptional regulator with XRE-family HTH domain
MKSDAMSLNNIIGSTLAELRKNNGFTQKELAKIFNISEGTLAHYEQGLTPPSAAMLIKFADYFHVPVDYLLGRCQNKVEYRKLNEKLASNMSLGDMVNAVSNFSQKNRKYLFDTILLILKSEDSLKGKIK